MRGYIYCRISRDIDGEAAGVRRQEAECRTIAALRQIDVIGVLVDNDVSAYSGAPRPAYAQLLELVQGGAVDVVLAWHPDRLHRSLRELEEFIAAIDQHDVDVVTVTAGDIDLSTPIGRMIARQLGTFARYESEHRSERVKAALRQTAEEGRWSGRRPFGYDLVRDADGAPVGDGLLVVVPYEAALIREAAERILSGETVYGVCKDFQERGVTSPLGRQWRTPSLRAVLVSSTTAGLREHRGEVVGKGLWQPILTRDQHEGLRQRLTDNRRTKGTMRARSQYLLTGALLECGRCGHRLETQWHAGRNARRTYACVKSVDKDGCGRTSVSALPLEQVVVDQVFDRLGRDNVARLMANPNAFQREIRRRTAAETRLLDAAALYASGEISRVEWKVVRESLGRQLRTMPEGPAHLGGLTLGNPDDAHDEWKELHVERRRALLQLVIDRVVVMPTAQKGPKFDQRRVVVRWR